MGAPGHFSQANLVRAGADIDGMAARVLTGMFASGGFDPGAPARPSCEPGVDCAFLQYQKVATGPAHVQLAREVAAASTVLLKNDGGVLPVRRGARIALVGSACNKPFLRPNEGQWNAADYYTIGGAPALTPTPAVHACERRAGLAFTPSHGSHLPLPPSRHLSHPR